MQLKDEILSIMEDMREKIKSNEILSETSKKQISIPVILLLLKTNASLEEMRKAIEELKNEGKISLSIDDPWRARINKALNQKRPEALSEQLTEDKLFVFGWDVILNE